MTELEENISTQEQVAMDEVADVSIGTLQGILSYFDFNEITIDEYEGEDDDLILDITGDDLAVLIGRYGRTLEALQFIVSSINYRKLGYRFPVTVDVEGYKGRQRDKLESYAHSAANKAVNKGCKVSMKPMSPYERRLIHMALQDNKKVTTESEGEGSQRHVVVIPI